MKKEERMMRMKVKEIRRDLFTTTVVPKIIEKSFLIISVFFYPNLTQNLCS